MHTENSQDNLKLRLRRRSLFERLLIAPKVFRCHYAIHRTKNDRLSSAKAALALTLLLIKAHSDIGGV